jgi:hypothetical protein
MMMSDSKLFLGVLGVAVVSSLSISAVADVEHQQVNELNHITRVSDDAWQPEGFVNGTPIPATWIPSPDITIDGDDNEVAWSSATEVEVPLSYGSVEKAWLKALYTDDEVFIRARWADATEDRLHQPWIWDAELGSYVAGPQSEDSVLLSFEAGCEWTPSLLGGYMYDFDAWHWMAARSDPLGQAVDLYGNVQDKPKWIPNFHPYPSRVVEDDVVLKFIENQDVDLHADWNELERVYMTQPVNKKLWVRKEPDGEFASIGFAEQLPAPSAEPVDEAQIYPQFSPIKLSGRAGEVQAKGQWKDGFWTVEFRRARETPAGHLEDVIFNRLVQFSVNVFDRTERLDQASESPRLFLRFLEHEPSQDSPADLQLVNVGAGEQ